MAAFLSALLRCLCGGSDDQDHPQQQQTGYAGQPPQVVQQPSPVYPPQHPQQQPYSPPAQQHTPSYAQAAQEHAEPGPKKHKKTHSDGQTGHQNGVVHSPSPGPGRTSSPPVSSSPPIHRPWSPGSGRPDPNQVNQSNPHYTDLRARANRKGDEMARNFEEAHNAYESGDKARAKELSNAGKAAQREMQRLNEEASAWIFRENNTDSGPGEVDLHGLYVKEAIKYADQSIEQARGRGDTKIHFIVGKGIHSSGAAKIKPAIEELMQKHGLVAELDEQNSGVLIVNLDGQLSGGGRVMGADQLSRGLEKKDECTIM